MVTPYFFGRSRRFSNVIGSRGGSRDKRSSNAHALPGLSPEIAIHLQMVKSLVTYLVGNANINAKSFAGEVKYSVARVSDLSGDSEGLKCEMTNEWRYIS